MKEEQIKHRPIISLTNFFIMSSTALVSIAERPSETTRTSGFLIIDQLISIFVFEQG